MYSEFVNLRRTDNTMAERRRTDNTMAERRTDNTMAERRTDNTMAERKSTNNDVQHATQKTQSRPKRTPLKCGVEFRCCEG